MSVILSFINYTHYNNNGCSNISLTGLSIDSDTPHNDILCGEREPLVSVVTFTMCPVSCVLATTFSPTQRQIMPQCPS